MNLKEIVKSINDTLKSVLKHPKFQKGVFHGLAKLVLRKENNDSDSRYVAVIYNSDGKEINCTVDDTFPFGIYHRCTSSTFTAIKDQFGDGTTNYTQSDKMIAVLYGNKDVVQMTQEQFGSVVAMSFPSTATITGLGKVNITINSINNDSFAVYNAEYKSTDYQLKPEDLYCAINYTVDTTFDKSCIETCTEC